MLLTCDEIIIFKEMRAKLLALPKYNPNFHLTEKISERDFYLTFADIVSDEKSKNSPNEWPLLQEHLFEKFFEHGNLTVRELEAAANLEQLVELKNNVFTKAERNRMIKESEAYVRKDPRDDDEQSRVTEIKYSHQRESSGDENSASQPELPADSSIAYISGEQRKKELEAKYLESIQKNILR